MGPILIVPDVNVIVSGTTISQGPPSQIIQSWQENQIQIATSPSILKELRKVLGYDRVVELTRLSSSQVDVFVELFRQSAKVVAGTIPVTISPDPDDNKFFSCALEAQAKYIVSGDKKHILSIGEYQGIETISPTDFVKKVLHR